MAWDVCRPFLGLQFVPPRAEVVGEWWAGAASHPVGHLSTEPGSCGGDTGHRS